LHNRPFKGGIYSPLSAPGTADGDIQNQVKKFIEGPFFGVPAGVFEPEKRLPVDVPL
jgi:hypothetical protein